MMKSLAPRPLRFFLGAFAVAGFVVLALDPAGIASLPAVTAQSAAPAARPLPTGDLPDVAIETADGARTSFAATDGHLRIATMLYGHCPGVCPMTIGVLRGIERQLTAQQRSKLSFIVLSLDPARDTPEALRSVARERGMTSSRWLVGRTSVTDARRFADAAGIQYRALSDGSIDHSTALVLLDARGRVLARMRATDDSTELMASLRGVL